MTTTSVPTGATHPVTPLQASAASATASPPRRRSIAGPLTALQAICHMALLAGYGLAVFITLGTLLGIGVGLAIALVGLVLLLAFVYLLYGAAFLETARVEGLYRFGLPTLLPRRSPKQGFPGFLHTVWLQFIDGGTWRAIAHLAIGTVLGYVVWSFAMTFVWALTVSFAPLWGGAVRAFGIDFDQPFSFVATAVIAIVSLAALYGVAVLHGAMSRVIVAPMREAQLAAQAREASYRAEQATAQAYSAASQRADAIRAGELERTRIERDLHDGVQPRLVSVGMTLGLAQTKIESDPDQAKGLVAEAHTSTKAAITELRQLARGIHASVLDDRGLDAALSALAGRSHIPVHLDVRVEGNPGRDEQAAMYFAIAESLTNAAKHSRATDCRVVVRSRPDVGQLWARIEDNGVGGARIVPGGGLDGIRSRITALGGTARLESPNGGPTSLEVSVPCAF
ncbi:sensor histidine kinase [Microbacterium halotolerans]|uniref:sensor histidine kinase n=1 Tax=Microbacterium halotolerans TaxID=246613 RepID=UPI000E6AB042|nr:sensor histidine kinase [Microbacterium halotolerans]